MSFVYKLHAHHMSYLKPWIVTSYSFTYSVGYIGSGITDLSCFNAEFDVKLRVNYDDVVVDQ